MTSYTTLEEAVEIARNLAPRLRQRVWQAEQLRRLPDDNVADLLASGLIHLYTPRRWGGAELSLDAIIEVSAALAEGCGSTGWVYALCAAHVWHIAQWPEHIQEMVLTSANPLISTAVNSVGEVRIVEGGYVVSGKGSFSSGVDHSAWLMPRISFRLSQDDAPEPCYFLVPRSDFAIVDDWDTVGLRGTGSKAITLSKVFVPDERMVPAKQFDMGTVGALLHKTPLFCADRTIAAILSPAGTVLGIARAMIKTFEERCSERINHEQTAALLRLARAAAEVDSAHALVAEDARRFGYMPANEVSDQHRLKCRRDVAYAAQLCRHAVNSLFEASGSNSVYEDSDLSRLWRDSNVASAHTVHRWDLHGLNYGRSVVGSITTEDTGFF